MSIKTRSGAPQTVGILVFILILLVTGQLITKQGARHLELGWDHWLDALPFLLLGYTLLFTRGLVWVALLRHVALSLAYPLVALSYVAIIAASHYLFDEAIGPYKLAGAGLIILGVSVLGVSKLKAQQAEAAEKATSGSKTVDMSTGKDS